jgi:integrase
MPRALVERRVKGLFERPKASGIWWIDYSVNGTRIREKIGGKKKAQEAYDKRRAAAWTELKVPTVRKVRFAVLVEDALEHSRKKKLKDMKTLTGRLTRLTTDFGDKSADSITPTIIEDWLATNTRTPATSNRFKAVFSKVFKLAVRNGKLMVNAASKVEPQAENNGRIRWIAKGSPEEKRLHKVVLEHYPHRMSELTISFGTGMRLGEQYSLTWGCIDFEAGKHGYVRLDETKNGSHRDIPMSPEVRAAFEEIRSRQENVQSDDRVFDINTPRKWFESAVAKAKISDYTWHCNRHSFCSRLAKSGAHIGTIQKLAGHKTVSMSARYTHIDDDTRAEAVLGIV